MISLLETAIASYILKQDVTTWMNTVSYHVAMHMHIAILISYSTKLWRNISNPPKFYPPNVVSSNSELLLV